MSCKAAVFDLDGVITATAQVHFRAWKQTFDDYLRQRQKPGERQFQEFSYEQDYIPYVDGRPRYQGVRRFLASRDIRLPHGDPSDQAQAETICGIGNRKNALFRDLLHQEGVELFDSTVAFARNLAQQGIKLAVASSSADCGYILQETGLDRLFQTVVDGRVSRRLGLKGKPEPDIFLLAAERLGVAPYDCMMVEDACVGVQAGGKGNFGLVLGVARTVDAQLLLAHGADLVIEDMAQFSLADLDQWFTQGITQASWNLSYHGFAPTEERLREALTTVGNGYFGTRGAFVGEAINDDIHYPGTYVSGLFNQLKTEVHGKSIQNNDFVNCPNWLAIQLRVENGEELKPLTTRVQQWHHFLDMRQAVTVHEATFCDAADRVTTIRTRRIASMDRVHLGAIEYSIIPRNYSGSVTLRSRLDGTVYNYGVERYRQLSSKHLEAVASGELPAEGDDDGQIRLQVRTSQSAIDICMNAVSRFYLGQQRLHPSRQLQVEPGLVTEVFTLDVQEGREYRFEKTVSIFTSAHWDSQNPAADAREALRRVPSFGELLERHRAVWNGYWNLADFVVDGDRFAQKALRLHVYHLLATANPVSTFVDNGLPARGLHGEAYRGHIFWDELFISPFYNLHFPEVTHSHLMYRYRRLDAARRVAREEGFAGALYPWQSAGTGLRESQQLHYNPRSGRWDPDLSYLQRHINNAIAYDIWEYFFTTNDTGFVEQYGIEMLLEMARFWADITRFDEDDERYHIRKVMGPDEFHEKYPHAEEGGLDDNAYTNIMTAWLLHKTIETYCHMPSDVRQRVQRELSFDESELRLWRDIVQRMYVPMRDDGIIEQFAGWWELQELDWNAYRRKHGNIRRLDRILKAEGTTPDRYKAIKQADVLQCFYMLAPAQVAGILHKMGCEVGDPIELLRRNYDHYVPRTSHGSTLSYVVHSSISNSLASHQQDAWNWFREALASDIYDTQGGTTPEGIHCGVMAGSLEILLKGFAGINLFKDRIVLHPRLPDNWRRLAFKILHRGNRVAIDIVSGEVRAWRLENGTERELECTADGARLTVRLV
ncbi:MAG: beta-phosphoglucomutase family hydrolase [Spirochaetaceae bacterium]|nr:MAG: beta-phosphoglucomutase family hydrolase [Spirochaetaceae bacterium]